MTVRGAGSDGAITLGRPTLLNVPDNVTLVALAPGGTRFLAVRELSAAPATTAIVENFFEELRAKLPAK